MKLRSIFKWCSVISLLIFFVSLLFVGGAIDADRNILPFLIPLAGSIIGVFVFARLEERCQDNEKIQEKANSN